ncbi:MAG: hypothetical protein ACM30G_20835 [Micromonosporaceae bacterium]
MMVGSALAVTAAPANAGLAPRYGSAYVWANDPTSAIGVPYLPSLGYQFNSSFFQNRVIRQGTGAYAVHFPGIDPYGTALVTAYGGSDERCKILSWAGAPGYPPPITDTWLHVRCFTRTGAPVNTRFTASYTYPEPGVARAAYLWHDQPSAPLGVVTTPSLTYQYNSEGSPNTVTRVATGAYFVRLTGLSLLPEVARNLQVTAYGAPADPSASCSMGNDPAPPGEDEYPVNCYTAAGTPINSSFVLTYVENGNHLLAPTGSHPTALAQVTCHPLYPPPGCLIGEEFDTNPTETASLDVIGPGQYAVHLPVSLSGGNVSVGNLFPGRCKVAYWSSAAGVRVNCSDLTGAAPVYITFAVSFVG